MAERGHEEVPVGGHAAEVHPLQGQGQATCRFGACRTVGDHLGQHGIEVDTHVAALLDARVPPDRRFVGRAPGDQRAGGGEEPGRRVLGVEAGLDCVSVEADVVLAVTQRLTGGDAQLFAHQVDSGHLLGDGVFDLESGVHLQEEELSRGLVHQELDGSRRPVADAAGQLQGRLTHDVALFGAEGGCRRLLDDLLVATLDRAFPLAQVDQAPVGVAQDLDLDVAGAGHVALQEYSVVAERTGGLPLGGGHRLCQVLGALHQVHALAAAACRRLDQDRIADLVVGRRVVRGGKGGHASSHCGLLGGQLVAHRRDDLRRRADPDDAGGLHGCGEAGVLSQEAVAGMDGVRTGGQRRGDDRLAVEVAGGKAYGLVGFGHERGVGVGVHEDGDAAHAHGARRTEDPSGDLAPVGDQDRAEWGGAAHSRNTPYF